MSFPESYRIAIITFMMTVCLTTGNVDDLSGWRCKSGQMINVDEICDGWVNCSDESDETAEECMSLKCPTFAFRCAYGACVTGYAKCNGVKDCADNSDETKCSNTAQNRRIYTTNMTA